MTVLDLYTLAFSEVGASQPNQTPSGAFSSWAQLRLELMITTWSERRERLFYIPESPYPLVAGQGVYQIGPGAADFDTTLGTPPTYVRPVEIQTAYVIVGVGRRYALNILSRPQWQANQNRSLTDPDGPLDIFYDNNRPIATINLAPIPGTVKTLYLSQWNPLHVFKVGDEAVVVDDFYPQAYRLALVLGLAIEMSNSFRFPVSPELKGKFDGAIAIIENKNVLDTTGELGPSRSVAIPTRGEPGMMMGPPQPRQ